MSGLLVICTNWSSRLSPPTSRAHLRLVNLASSLANLRVCRASSREGDKTIPLAPAYQRTRKNRKENACMKSM